MLYAHSGFSEDCIFSSMTSLWYYYKFTLKLFNVTQFKEATMKVSKDQT